MPSPTYDLLASSVLTSSASSVTFSSISQDYRDLVLVIDALASTSNALASIQLNSSSSGYSQVFMRGDGSAATSGTETSLTGIDAYIEATSTERSMSIVQFFDYAVTDKHKSVLIRANTASARVSAHAARWANTAAVTSLTINAFGTRQYASGSTFYLYGIAS